MGRRPVRPCRASSGETVRQRALGDQRIACLAGFMTSADRTRGVLVQLVPRDTLEQRELVHAVYFRNTARAARIRCFVDYLAERMAARG